MRALLVIALAVVLRIVIQYALIVYERNRYIPVEERMQSCIPGYEPWSKEERKYYYDKEVLQGRLDDMFKPTLERKYRSTMETGYYDRRY